MINRNLPLTRRHSSVQTLVRVVSQLEVICQDVQHVNHLTEDKDTMTVLLELGKQSV
jgi:hypothetical protein